MKIEKAPHLHFCPLRSSFFAQLGGQAITRNLGLSVCRLWYFHNWLHCLSHHQEKERMEVK